MAYLFKLTLYACVCRIYHLAQEYGTRGLADTATRQRIIQLILLLQRNFLKPVEKT